jgi:hypothetical protein
MNLVCHVSLNKDEGVSRVKVKIPTGFEYDKQKASKCDVDHATALFGCVVG